jgi:hypothetical protein
MKNQIEIKNHVKKLKIKDTDVYQNSRLNITVLLTDGRRSQLKTTGFMTVGEIVNALIEGLH